MPVPTATAPQPPATAQRSTLGAVAAGVSAALSHQATVAAHTAFPSTHGVKRAALPQELPPSKQPRLAASARPPQAEQPAWSTPQGGKAVWRVLQPTELAKPAAPQGALRPAAPQAVTHYRITHESSLGCAPFHKM